MSWKQLLHSCQVHVWLLILLSLFGCVHASQVRDDRNATARASLRPIDLEPSAAEKIGQEALQKIGYEEIIRLAEKAGFVEHKLNVSVQLASYGSVVDPGFVRVFSRYALAAAVTSQADSPLPGPADLAAVGVIVVGLADAGLLDGYLLNTLGGWIFSQAKTDAAAGAARVEFPSAGQIAGKLGVSEAQFHRQIKPAIVQDLAPEARKLGTKNPDIGVDSAGRVALRNPKTGDTAVTDVLLESYKP